MERSSRWVLAICAVAAIAAATGLRATTIIPARIASEILVLDGNVVFVLPDGGVTVLDAATGAVRLRTAPRADAARCELFQTDAGILVSSWTAFRMIALAGPAIAWTLDGCDGYFRLTGEGLLCVSSERSRPATRARLALHRLTDGKPLWTYRPRGAVNGEQLAGRGRLMITFENWTGIETVALEQGSWTGPVRHVVGLTVLDLASGRELLPRVSQDVQLDGSVREPIHFDGERITYVMRRGRGTPGPCGGERQRVLTLNAAASAYTTELRCEPRPKVEPWTPPTLEELRAAAVSRTRQLPGASVTMGWFDGATLVDVTTGGGRWLAGIPEDYRLSPHMGTVRHVEDLLLVESNSDVAGRLDAFDHATGVPRWTFVYPSFMKLGSTNYLSDDKPPEPDERAWAGVRANPPGGAFQVPLDVLTERDGMPRAGRFRPDGRGPVTVDPGPPGPPTP